MTSGQRGPTTCERLCFSGVSASWPESALSLSTSHWPSANTKVRPISHRRRATSRPAHLSVYVPTSKLEVPIGQLLGCASSKIWTGSKNFKKWSLDPDHAPFEGNLSSTGVALCTIWIYKCAWQITCIVRLRRISSNVTNIISNNNVIALAYAGILTDRQTERKGAKTEPWWMCDRPSIY